LIFVAIGVINKPTPGGLHFVPTASIFVLNQSKSIYNFYRYKTNYSGTFFPPGGTSNSCWNKTPFKMQNCIISAVCLHGDKIALKSFVQIMLHWITMQNC